MKASVRKETEEARPSSSESLFDDKAAFAVIAIVSLLYLFLVSPYLSLPPLGKHAWNEALYLAFIGSISDNNNPILLYSAYDPGHPDFNVGYLYFWAEFVCVKSLGIPGLLPGIVLYRMLSILSTLALPFILYLIMKEFKIGKEAAALAVSLVLISPLVLHYGWKAQLEPFLILAFAVSQLLRIRYLNGIDGSQPAKMGPPLGLYASCALFGMLLASRSNFLIFVPLYALPSLIAFLRKDARGSIVQGACVGVIIALSIVSMILPAQLLYPQFDPSKFFFQRLSEAQSSGAFIGDVFGVPPYQAFLLDALGGGLLTIVPLAAFSITIVFGWKSEDALKSYFVLSGALISIFFLMTFPHVANHTYHVYYGLVWLALAGAISLDWLCLSVLDKRVPEIALLIILVSHIVLCFLFSSSYYGLFTNDYLEKTDSYGTYTNFIAGTAIHEVISHIRSPSGFVLVQSPVQYYPIKFPSLGYNLLYTYLSDKHEYLLYDYFIDQDSFLDEMKRRELLIIAVTPDMGASMRPAFRGYLDSNFQNICHADYVQIYMNRTVLEEYPDSVRICQESIQSMKMPS